MGISEIDLRSVIKNHPDYLLAPKRLKTTLLGLYPGKAHKRDINIILIILESGMLSGIIGKESVPSEEIESLMSRLEEEYGVSPIYSKQCFLIWLEVWGTSDETLAVTADEVADEQNETKSSENPESASTTVIGTPEDYELEKQTEGWIIKKFIGFEEENGTVPNMIGGKSIIGIGQEAYEGCCEIKSVLIADGIRFIENGVFKNCKKLQSANFPKSLEKIGDKAFYDTALLQISLPANVESVGEHAFAFCRNLQKASFGEKLSDIGDHAFRWCLNLTQLHFSNSLRHIGRSAFEYCGLTEVHIPNGTTHIGSEAFSGCPKLKAIYIPSSVEQIKANSIGILGSSSKATIYCNPSSAALAYARKYGYNYKRM